MSVLAGAPPDPPTVDRPRVSRGDLRRRIVRGTVVDAGALAPVIGPAWRSSASSRATRRSFAPSAGVPGLRELVTWKYVIRVRRVS